MNRENHEFVVVEHSIQVKYDRSGYYYARAISEDGEEIQSANEYNSERALRRDMATANDFWELM